MTLKNMNKNLLLYKWRLAFEAPSLYNTCNACIYLQFVKGSIYIFEHSFNWKNRFGIKQNNTLIRKQWKIFLDLLDS